MTTSENNVVLSITVGDSQQFHFTEPFTNAYASGHVSMWVFIAAPFIIAYRHINSRMDKYNKLQYGHSRYITKKVYSNTVYNYSTLVNMYKYL